MSVKAVTEICSKFYRPWRGRMANASRNGMKTVSVLPCHFNSLLKLLNVHHCWTKNDVLAVIKLPIFCENTAFCKQPLVKCRVRKRCDNGETRQINFCLHGKLCCLE